MDYEKKYKEALERARNLHKDAIDMGENIRAKQCEIIFPEIKESEDEMIRKELITHCRNTRCVTEEGAERIAKWISWLEKQGESSGQIHYWTEEEIEPIISDYLRGAEHYGGMIGRLRCLKPKSLEKQSKASKVEEAMKEVEAKAKAFTAAHQGENADEMLAEMRGEDKHKFKIGDIISNGKVVYRVDGFAKNCVGEDSYFLVNVEMEKNGIRYTPVCDSNGTVHNAGEIMWLCDQVDQMFQKVLEEKSEPAWSEEDESMRQYVVNDLRFVKELVNDPNYAVNVEKVEEEINWLKSLRPQNTWKPSDEQMENLSRAFNGATYQVSLLRDLYLDLKKLREE